jgi:O-succinylbenzoate synthase
MSNQVAMYPIEAVQHSLRLRRELSFLPHPRDVKEIAIIAYTLEGEHYVGEISPLPGFSLESLSEALKELDSVRDRIPPLSEACFDCGGDWSSFLRDIRCPSLRCGVEGVLVDYLFKDRARYQAALVRSHVACNALLIPELDTSLDSQLAAALEKGFRSIKIKISPRNSSEVVSSIERFAGRSECSFRLDANRSFPIAEFRRLVPHLNGLPIEYFEEPVSDIAHLPELISECLVPIALDETTRELDVDGWISWGAKSVVLKPSLNGGLLSILPLINRVGESGARVTLSSSFESGVGLRAIALLASLASSCGAVGLDTASFLEDDLLWPHFPIGRPQLSVEELVRCRYRGEEGG